MTLKNLTVAALIFITSAAYAGNPFDAIFGGGGKNKNLFVVKTDKKFVGATIEILSEEGELITAQSLEKRKMIIDFGSVEYGTYIVRISKGNDTQEFQYVKK